MGDLPEFKSVGDLFLYRVGATPEVTAYSKPNPDESWSSFTWKQVGDEVRAVAMGLRAIGLQDEERVAILSGTRLEWIFADLGILCGAGATTTIYPSNTGEDCAFILTDSDTRYVFAEDMKQVEKLQKVKAEIPNVRKIVVFDGKDSADGDVLTLATLQKMGREHDAKSPGEYERIAKSPSPASLATLIYTSGTTGKPKGVELTHDNWLYEGQAIDDVRLLAKDDVQYFWLPLAHSFGKVLEMAQLRIGFQTAVDGRIEKIVENLGVVKPTFMCGVPRIFEKVHNRIVGLQREKGGMTWRIFQWAFEVGREVSKLRQQGKEPSGFLGLKHTLAKRLVFSKIAERFGGRLRFFISGSAPLSRDIAEWFHAADLLICEGYGLTETSAASFVNRPDKYKFGTVGFPFPGTEVKIAPSDGEILIRGRGVMRGYHHLAESTAETIKDGWLCTGDIGEIDGDGFLRITDRKKDLIKTSGGKYVAPSALEGKFKAICPYVSQVVVHGDNRNFCSALIALDPEAINKWAAENGLAGKSYEDLSKDAKVVALIQPYVDTLNSGLASYETIKRFALLPKDVTEADGFLTPSQKLKRKAVEKHYKAILDGFYEGSQERM